MMVKKEAIHTPLLGDEAIDTYDEESSAHDNQ
jgi:hypothetical protein